MAKNKLEDLNNHLFLQLERLNEEDLTDEQLAKETLRSKHITSISKEIREASKVTLDAMRFIRNEVPINQQVSLPSQFKGIVDQTKLID